ncbi:hypothetical protein GGI08_005216, partial [Coemansia sp. S2]
MYINANNPNATDDQIKAALLTNLSESARTWAVLQFDAATNTIAGTAGEFATHLPPFADVRQAEAELEQIEITTTVAAYIKMFNVIVARIPNMEDEDMRRQFVHGLKNSVRQAVDRASPATQQRNPAPQTTAMDVDAIHAPRFNCLTDEECAYLRSINACFCCHQPRHRSNTCLLNNSHPCQQQFHQHRSPQVNSFEIMPQCYHGYLMPFGPGFMPMYPGYSFPLLCRSSPCQA